MNLTHIASDINSAHDKAMVQLVRVGCMLIEVQAELTDDSFQDLVSNYLNFSKSSAYNYMRLYQHSIVQPLDTLGKACVSVWYHLPPDNTHAVKAVIERLEAGKKVTTSQAKELARQIAPLNEAIEHSAQVAPTETANALIVGAITGIDGHDIPLTDTNATDIRLSAETAEYERYQRQRQHMQGNATKRHKLQATLHTVTDANGQAWLAVDGLPSLLAGKQVTIYYDNESEGVDNDT